MDHDKRNAIISWINCINAGPALSSLWDLRNGRHFISIVKLLNNGSKETDILLENWPFTLQTFLVDYYGDKVKRLVIFDKELLINNELEIAKVAVLVLCASIKCDTKAVFVNPLTKLAADTQLHIKEIIESVFTDWIDLQSAKFVEILMHKGNSGKTEFTTMNVCNTSDSYCYEGSTVSPIKQLLQSPEVFHKLTLRDKDQEISRLKNELESERIDKSYLESDLLNSQETVQRQNSTITQLKSDMMKLKSHYSELDDYKTLLDNKQTEIQKLILKCKRLDEKLSDYDNIKISHNSLNADHEKLEKEFQSFQNAHKSCDVLQKRCQELECSVESLTMSLQDKDEQVLKLASRIQRKEIQLNELDSLYNETVVLLECAKTKHNEKSGEVMSVVTDLMKLEDSVKEKERELESCRCLVAQLKNELQQNQIILSDTKMKLVTLETVLEEQKTKNIESTRALAALEEESSQERKKLQNEITSKQNEIDGLTQVMRDKEEELAKLKLSKNEALSRANELLKQKESLEEEVKEHQKEISQLKQRIESSDKDLIEYKEQVQNLRNDVIDLKKEISEKESISIVLNEECSALKSVIQSQRVEIEETARALGDLEDNCNQERNSFRIDIASKESAIADLKRVVKEKEEELVKLELFKNEAVHRTSELTQEKYVLDQDVKKFQQEVAHLKKNLNFSEEVSKNYEKDVQKLMCDIVNMEQQIAVKTLAFSNMKEKNSLLETVVEKLKGEITDTTRALAELEDKYNKERMAMQVDITSKRNDIEQLGQAIELKTKELSELEFVKNEVDLQVEKLIKQKECLDEDVKNYQEEILHLKQSLGATEGELKINKEDVLNLQRSIMKLENESTEKESIINNLKTEYAEDKAILVNELQLQTDANKQLKEEHEMECNDLKTTVAELETKISQLLMEIESKLRTISDLEELKIEHERRISELLSQESELLKMHDCHVQQLTDDNENMKEKLERTEEKLVSLKTLVEKLKTNAADMMLKAERTNELFTQKKEMLKSSLLEKNNEIENLKQELTRKDEFCQNQKTELEQNMETITAERDSLRIDVNNCNNRIEKLHLELTSKEEIIATCERELECGQKAIVRLQSLLSDKDLEINVLLDKDKNNQAELQSHEETTKKEVFKREQLRETLEITEIENQRLKKECQENESVIKLMKDNHARDVQAKQESITVLQKQVEEFISQLSVLQLQNHSLIMENQRLRNANQTLETECRWLHDASARTRDICEAQMEFTESVKQIQKQVNDSEKQHIATVGMMKEKIETLSDKYETAKLIISELTSEKDLLSDKLAQAKSNLESTTSSLNDVVLHFKEEQEKSAFLTSNLLAEQKKNSLLSEKVTELERRLNSIRMSELQANAAQKAMEAVNKHSNTKLLAPPSLKLHYDDDDNISRPELRLSSFSINSQDKDISKNNNTYNVIDNSFFPSIRFPGSAGSYFPCADEEGEMFNFSYLNDLKNGKCDTEDHPGRLSELQRRNTLCLPHLRSSYPVETQMVPSVLCKDDDLKTGVSKDDLSLGLKLNSSTFSGTSDCLHHSDTDVKRKPKAIQPTYNKPGPPTPGKSSKVPQVKEKQGKTPSSLKKLLKRPPFATPNKMKNTSAKRNLENLPPEVQRVTAAPKNIAFSIGFSPKVKLQPKSLMLNNRPHQTSTPQGRRKN